MAYAEIPRLMPREVRQCLTLAVIIGAMMLLFWLVGVEPPSHFIGADGIPVK